MTYRGRMGSPGDRTEPPSALRSPDRIGPHRTEETGPYRTEETGPHRTEPDRAGRLIEEVATDNARHLMDLTAAGSAIVQRGSEVAQSAAFDWELLVRSRPPRSAGAITGIGGFVDLRLRTYEYDLPEKSRSCTFD